MLRVYIGCWITAIQAALLAGGTRSSVEAIITVVPWMIQAGTPSTIIAESPGLLCFALDGSARWLHQRWAHAG
ncbi:hypothetical protein C4J96_2427 [Pseudomonas orientalis]|nr:hypothetical protein C4J96_2427 [Pseudomonas orientalis]